MIFYIFKGVSLISDGIPLCLPVRVEYVHNVLGRFSSLLVACSYASKQVLIYEAMLILGLALPYLP